MVPSNLDTASDLAQFLNVSLAAIRKWTRTTDLPRVQVSRRAIRFERAEVLAWLKARQVRNGKEGE